MMFDRVGIFCLFAAYVHAAVTVSSCLLPQITNALFKPPSDNTVHFTCSGTVMVNSTLFLPDGFVFNATNRLVLVATGNFPIFSLKGSAYIGGVTLKGGKGTNGGCMTTEDIVITNVTTAITNNNNDDENNSSSSSSGSSNSTVSYVTSMENTNLTLLNVRFENCVASGMGGGLFIQKSVVAELTSVQFWDCSADSGGGLALSSQVVSVNCANCDFRNNTASGLGGGALFTQDTSFFFTSAEFINNHAVGTNSSGGAIYNLQSTLDCSDCLFQSNSATARAGAVYVQGATSNAVAADGASGTVRFVDSNFLNNTGMQRGSVIFVCIYGNDEFTVLNGALCDNQLINADAAYVGTAIHADCEGDLGLDTVTFAGNLPNESAPFAATFGTTMMFLQDDVDTDSARATCDNQQNLTKYPPTSAPTPGVISDASSIPVVMTFVFLLPLVWL